MIAARQNDGAFGAQTWPVGTAPGQWRPTPPLLARTAPGSPHLKPFLIPSASMFRTSGPPALTSAAYARDLNEVKALGSASSTVRTPDQTEAAIWWHDRRLVEWEIKRQLATTQRLSTLQTARMFAMVDLAEADTLIACYTREGSAGASGDRSPRSSSPTPTATRRPSPTRPGRRCSSRRRTRSITSGHACFTAASMTSRALLRPRRHLLQRLQRRLRHHPALQQLLPGDRRGHRGPHLGRHPLPHRGRRGREDRRIRRFIRG